ncbi:ABC transporter permease [Loigolactobacillus coryniformis]|uniref:ABC transporter permease n=1 Tax=Loigolactobacillus coryniformis TaxID=1610 RepID=UPI00201A3540|nr:ABC transporter permease [Loigolactobacillus coryniformis]MCL5459218.1 ABC transporter permease [Loigolactobacillus coryniformis]
MTNTNYAKTGFLLRVYLRRDWLKIMLWLIGVVGLMAGAAGKFDTLYGSSKAMNSIITTLRTPAMVSLLGPFTAEKPYTVASVYAAEMMVFMGLFVAIMNIYFAIHATRTDEESGVAELVRARATGRNASLTAAILELVLINLIAGVLEAVGLQVSGMSGINAAGNWLFGFSLAAFGLMFGAFSLLAAQLASSSRSATILSYLILGLLFVARMVTDIQNTDLTWWTIYGWIEKLDIYGQNIWWPVGLMLILIGLVGGMAITLGATRDVGAGLLPQRAGRSRASSLLRGPLTLIARLERTSTIIWLVALFILGATYGSIFGTAGDLMKTNPTMAKLIGTTAVTQANRAIVLAFANKLVIIFVVLATVPGLITLFRLNRDERNGYFEQLHAKAVSRGHLYISIVAFGLVSAVVALLLGVLGMYVAGAASMGDEALAVSRFMRAFWGYAPALIVTFGIAALLAGLVSKLQNIAWAIPVYGLISLYLGPLLDFPKWATRISPYGWVNQVPINAVAWDTAGWMTALGLILILTGYLTYARRDLLVN